MINVSEKYLNKLNSDDIVFKNEIDIIYGSDDYVSIVDGKIVEKPYLTLTSDTIISVQLDEESCSGTVLELGSAVSQKATVKLYNDEYFQEIFSEESKETFTNLNSFFDNKILKIKSYLFIENIENEDGTITEKWEEVPLGYFILDDISYTSDKEIVTLTLYDKMKSLDLDFDYVNYTTAQFYQSLCVYLNPYENLNRSEISTSMFVDDSVTEILYNQLPQYVIDLENVTVRNLLGYYSAFNYGFACIDRYGKLKFTKYKDYGYNLTDDNIKISGYTAQQYSDVEISASKLIENNNNFTYGNDNTFNINCSILKATNTTPEQIALYYNKKKFLLQKCLNNLKGEYMPCTIDSFGNPAVTVGDIIHIVMYKYDEYGNRIENSEQIHRVFVNSNTLEFLGSGCNQKISCFNLNDDLPLTYNIEYNSFINKNAVANYFYLPFNNKCLLIQYGTGQISFKDGQNSTTIPLSDNSNRTPNIFLTPITSVPGTDFKELTISDSSFGLFTATGERNTETNTGFFWIAITDGIEDIVPKDTIKEYKYTVLDENTIRISDLFIQFGTTTFFSSDAVSGVSNTYAKNVYFNQKFDERPVVIVTNISTVPNQASECSVTTDSSTEKSKFKIYTYRSSDMPTSGQGVSWIALGRVKDK